MGLTRRQFLAGMIGAIAAGKLIEKLKLVALPKWVANRKVSNRPPFSEADFRRELDKIFRDVYANAPPWPEYTPFVKQFPSTSSTVWRVKVRS